jgi:hypothetical protein
MTIEPFKVRVIELALGAAAAHGFALAGGSALAAHGLLSRPTQDIDLFTPTAGGTGQVVDAVRTALAVEGYTVQLVRAAVDGDFAELHISRDGQSTQLDLGRDWRAHDAVRLDVGPVLHLDDAVGAKTTAARPGAAARLHRRRRRPRPLLTQPAARAGVHPRPRATASRRRLGRPVAGPAR